MYFYLILIVIISILSRICKNKKIFCVLTCGILIGVVGLRSPELGLSDTNNLYLPYFRIISNFSISELVDFVKSIDTEFLFYFMTYIVSKITINEQLYLILLCSPFYVITSIYICKYSKYPLISYLMIMSLSYFGFSFYALRHMIALSVLLIAYFNLKEGSKKKFVFYVLLATMFHRTAICFFIVYFLDKINFKNINYIITSILFYLFLVLNDVRILEVFRNISTNGHFSYYFSNSNTGTSTLFWINLILLWIICAFNSKKENYNNKEIKLYRNLQFLSCLFAACTLIINEAMRISSFFSIYSIISTPQSLHNIEDKKSREIIKFVYGLFLILYMLLFSLNNSNIIPYKFFIGG